MHIPQDVVNLIVDQLSPLMDCEAGDPGHPQAASLVSLSTDYETGDPGHLQAASLVSTAWVNPSQRHLFSTLELDDSKKIKRWCSTIKPDPCGVSRHVRVLIVGRRHPHTTPATSPLTVSDIKTALPHFAPLKNLQEFILGDGCPRRTPLRAFPQSSLRPLGPSSWSGLIVTYPSTKLGNTSGLSLTFCQILHVLSYQVFWTPAREPEFDFRLTRDARLPSNVSHSTNF